MAVRFVDINPENLLLASLIQLKIFKIASAFDDYEFCALNETGDKKFFIVYSNGEPIGVSGIIPDSKESEMCWVAWIGILPQFRGKGLGRQILEGMLELIKSKGYKFARLYTSRKLNVDAQFLYKKVMDLEETYMQEGEDFQHYVVFSKSLCDEPVPSFGNRHLHIKDSEKKNKEWIEHFKSYLKNFVCTLDKEKEMDIFENLLKTNFIHDFKAFERKARPRMLNYFDNKIYEVQVLKANDEILAYAISYKSKDGYFSMIDYYAVNAKYRNLGVGKLFLDIISQEKENIVVELEPFDWQNKNDINTRRAKFYERCGFSFPNIICTLRIYDYILSVKCKEAKSQQELKMLISNLYETVYNPTEFKIR